MPSRPRIQTAPRPLPRLPSRGWLILAVLVLLVGGAFLGSALAPSGSGKGRPFAVHALAGKTKPNPLAGRLSKVYGTDVPAKRYGTEVADLEDAGTNLAGEKISDLSPLRPSAFTAPEDHYRAYAEVWIARARSGAASLGRALDSGQRPAAKLAWESSWSDYMHLGAVYGLFGALNTQIDGTPDEVPNGASDPRFSGLHRIETGLWDGAPLHSLLGYDARLHTDLGRLRTLVRHVRITPLEYATRSHEILEDAQRDLLSGMDVPYSRQGVLGTAAGLAATEEVFHTLEPLLAGRDDTEGEVRYQMLRLKGLLARIQAHHGGRYPSLAQMGLYEHEQLNGYVAGALSALQEMPGTLETEPHRPIPKLQEHG